MDDPLHEVNLYVELTLLLWINTGAEKLKLSGNLVLHLELEEVIFVRLVSHMIGTFHLGPQGINLALELAHESATFHGEVDLVRLLLLCGTLRENHAIYGDLICTRVVLSSFKLVVLQVKHKLLDLDVH